MKNNSMFRKIIVLSFIFIFLIICFFLISFLYFKIYSKTEFFNTVPLEQNNISTVIENKPNNFWDKIKNSPDLEILEDKAIATGIAKVNQILDKTKEKILKSKETLKPQISKKTNIIPSSNNQLVVIKKKF